MGIWARFLGWMFEGGREMEEWMSAEGRARLAQYHAVVGG